VTEAPLPKPSKPLALWQVGVIFLAAVALELLLAGGVALGCGVWSAATGGGSPLELLLSPAGIALQIAFGSALLGGLALLVPRLRGVALPDALGLQAPSATLLGLAAVGVIPVGILSDEATYLVGSAAPSLFDTGVLDQFARSFAEASTPWFAILAAAIAVGPALGEELLFRGLILRGLAARIPGPAAALATAALFGAIHFDALQGLGAMLIGLYLAFAALVSGSLWPAVAAHAVNNLLCALFARFDPQGAGTAFDQGHPWYVLLGAAAALALVVVAMVRLARRVRPR
jgi:uncharacterized protein